MTPILALGTVILLLLVSGAAFSLSGLNRRERFAERLALARGRMPQERQHSPLQFIAMVGRAITESGLLSSKTLAELELTLTRSGFRSENGLGIFVAAKLMGMIVPPLFIWLSLRSYVSHAILEAAAAAGGVFGLLTPDLVIRRLRTAYVRRVDRGVADALDMMVICAEAGLGMTSAVGRVAAEIGPAHPSVAEELLATENELHMNPDARVALSNMGGRTGLPSLRRLAATLIQSQIYGTPLTHALRTLAAELRGEVLVRYEERAARLPALLTLPMIVFILPSVFLIVGGPAMIQVLRVMRH